MHDQDKTQQQLIAELAALRRQLAQRQAADEALRDSEAKYRRLHESMRDAFVAVDMEGWIQEYNESYRAMLGYAPDELLRLRYVDLTPERWHAFEAGIVAQQILPRGYSEIYEKEYRRKDGTVFPVELRTFLITDREGRPAQMWAIVRDITERKQAEEALRQARDELEQRVEERTTQLQAIHESLIDGMLIADVESRRFVLANPAICAMLGYTAAEILQLSVADIHPPADLPNIVRIFDEQVAGHYRLRTDLPVLRKDGSVLHADISANPLIYRGRLSLIGLFRDITEQKQAQEALERERQALWRMLQASDHERQIISYEIHDGLAQYLAAASMQLQVSSAQRGHSPDEARKAFATAEELVRQAHAEARRLISEVRPPVIDETGLETALAHLVHEQRRQGGPKIELDSDVQFTRLTAVLENALYRIVQEALNNACKHSQSKQVKVTLLQEGGEVRLSVQDWGVGFRPETVPPGHFGLEGIRQRVRLLGGRLTLLSNLGAGTLLEVRVPIVETMPDE